ncbi:MAG: sugar ABC transporter permease [Lachnospiraceae bacterium]|nr:sugar ABC transporter permease [Lachnospiraceae bacterium]
MKKQKTKVVTPQNKVSFKSYIKRYWQLYALLFLPMLYLVIFKYVPMSYIQIAFKKFKINRSIWAMPLADNNGFEYFIDAFSNPDFIEALRNTVVLNLLDLFIGFSIPVIFALILNELVFKRFKRVVQTIAYMPHFLSWVIISGMALQMFAPTNGLVNMFFNRMGMETVHFLDDPIHWVFTYIFLGIWQSFGWNSIVYLAAIAGINPELYEAASVDGASRWRKMWHITLPGIKSTIVILLIMNLGNILGSGFDRPFALQNNLVMDVAEVLSTFVYKNGILGLKFSLTTAIGFFQSIICVFFLLLANWISRRLGERGIW